MPPPATTLLVLAATPGLVPPWPTSPRLWRGWGAVLRSCDSGAELRAIARAERGRPAVALVDARLAGVDRDLLADLQRVGVSTVVVGPAPRSGSWGALGAAAHLEAPVPPSHLARVVAAARARAVRPTGERLGPLVAVVGCPGSGASTLAAAVAQDLVDHTPGPHLTAPVVLADLALPAHQGVLHHLPPAAPGLPELLDAHRTGALDRAAVRSLLHGVPSRGYRLLVGMRHPRDWVRLQAGSTWAALAALQRAAGVVVADIGCELDGEAETGSFDIEDRNLLARTAVRRAHVVLAVATGSATGARDLDRLLDDLQRNGVEAGRTLAVATRVPPRQVARRAVLHALGAPPVHPLLVPHVRGLDALHRGVRRLPAGLAAPVGPAVRARLAHLPPRPVAPTPGTLHPALLRPGTLGTTP